MREYMEVGQERQKTYYDRSRCGPSYKGVDRPLMSKSIVKVSWQKIAQKMGKNGAQNEDQT